MKIILFHSSVSKIGGIETLDYNLTKALSDYYEVLLLYKKCHPNQLYRLMQEVECEEYDPKKEYECDICICNSAWGGYPDAVTSKRNEYWQMIHADYSKMKETGWIYNKWNKTTRHIAVGQNVKDTFEKEYKEKADIIYNLLDETQETKPILKLVSATRLSSEKGYDRMLKLIEELKRRKIKFRWTIFTDLDTYKIKPIGIEEVIYMKTRYDIWDYIKEADYGVQLSDTEGYSYFVNECLQYGTAMLVTNFKSAYESVIDGVNGYILPFELFKTGTKEEWDEYLDKTVNKIPKDFKYEPKCKTDDWLKLLGNPDSKYKEIKKERKDKMKKIRALQNYTDSLLKKEIIEGDEYIVDNERAEEIVKVVFKGKPLAEIIEDVKEEVKGSVIAQPYQPLPYKNEKTNPKTTTKKKAIKK